MGSTSERPSNEPTDRHYQGGPGEGNDTPQAVLPPAVQSETGSSGMRFHFALHATWLVVIRDFPEEDHPHPWGSHPVGLSTYYETSHPDRDRGKSGQTDHVRGPDGVARGSARPGADTSGQGTGATRWTFPVASTRFAGIADRSKQSPRQLWRPALPMPPAGPPPSELRRAIPARLPGPFGSGVSQCRSGKSGRGTGRPPGGAATGPWKERFFSRAACSPPPSGPGLKAVLERPCSPIPCDEGEDLLKGGRSCGISGKAADWRCIHAHFPVMNQVIP